MSRRRYVRWRPSARAARVRLPPACIRVASMSRRLKSVTAPWKPGGFGSGEGEAMAMHLIVASVVPRFAPLIFGHMRNGVARGCRGLCAADRPRCRPLRATRAQKAREPDEGSRADAKSGRLGLGRGLDPGVVLEELLVQLDV